MTEQMTAAKYLEGADYVFVGNGQTAHPVLDKDAADTTWCGKPAGKGTGGPRIGKDVCKACTKKIEARYPAPVSYPDIDTIPGLGKNAKLNTTESDDVAAKSNTTKQNEEEFRTQVAEHIATVRNIAEAGSEDPEDQKRAADAADAAALLIAKLPTAERKALRDELKAAQTAEPETPAATAVVVLETQSVDDVDGGGDIIKEASEKIAEGVRLHLATGDIARTIAEAKLAFAVRTKDKYGYPDIKMTTAVAKAANSKMYAAAGAGFGDTPEARAALKKLIKSVQNVQGDIRVKYVRSLDENKEEAARFAAAIAAHPEASPSDAVFDFHSVARQSRQEIEAASAAEARKALANTDGEDGDENESDDESTTEATRQAKAFLALDRAEKNVTAATKNASKMTADEKADLKAKLDALVGKLAAAAQALATE